MKVSMEQKNGKEKFMGSGYRTAKFIRQCIELPLKGWKSKNAAWGWLRHMGTMVLSGNFVIKFGYWILAKFVLGNFDFTGFCMAQQWRSYWRRKTVEKLVENYSKLRKDRSHYWAKCLERQSVAKLANQNKSSGVTNCQNLQEEDWNRKLKREPWDEQ